MKVKSHLFSISKNLDSLLAAVIGFILIQIFAKHSGIGVSPDSVTYISVARHVVEGRGFLSFDNLPVVDFPIAYPFLLAILSFFTRLDPLQFGCFLNGILFGMLIYVSGAIMNGFQKPSAWYKRVILACILFSPAIQEVYSMFWSETVFLLLILFFIISLSRYLMQMTTGPLLVTALICAIACITRYAGLFLILSGTCLIFFNQEASWRKRVIHSLFFTFLSASGFLVNIIRNFLLTSVATGHREKNDISLLKIAEYFGGVLCDWLLLERKPVLAVMMTITMLFLFALTIYFTFRHKKKGYGFEYLASVTGLVYCFFMLFTSVFTRYEPFTSRLLSPMFIPLLWSLSWWIPGFISQRTPVMKWVSGFLFLFIAAGFLNIQLAADYEYYDGVKDAGVPGYREDPFVQSEIVQYVEKNKALFDPRFPIFSNAGDAVYFITGLPAHPLPVTAFPSGVQQYYGMKNTYLVWFRDLDNPEMPVLDSILLNKNMVILKQLPDGAVYFSK
jgi:hypothetical protein